jgi:2-polyprenyl-6-methoxyphenol hydroxylase-like FAD-dependent oxidoreductase
MEPERTYFLVTVDAEGDNVWSRAGAPTTANAGFLSRFQRLCESYGLMPTYLTTHEMAVSPVFREFAADAIARGAAEIGMHLHAWDSPPIVPLTSNDNTHHPYLTEFAEPIMRAKIVYLTRLLEDTFGVPITSHRAGRWGFNDVYARLLIEQGYLVDSSVTPGLSWRDHPGDPRGTGGPDYTVFPERPYFIDPQDIGRQGTSALLEVPVTSVDPRPTAVRWMAERLRSGTLPYRALRRWWPPVSALLPVATRPGLTRRTIRQALADRRPCLHLAIHSSELMPGGSPKFPTPRDVDALYDQLEAIFDEAKGRTVGAGLTEFRRAMGPTPAKGVRHAAPVSGTDPVSDVIIVGAGLTGTTAAAVLGRTCKVVLVDPRATCPPIFKAEKIEADQAEILRRLDLLRPLIGCSGQIRRVDSAYEGRVFHRRDDEQYGLPYDVLVNTLAGQVPQSVKHVTSRVVSIQNTATQQTVQLEDGTALGGRLVILACGLQDTLLASLGLERRMVQREHSIAFGFTLEPKDHAFDFAALTCYPRDVTARVDYISLFAFRDRMRANMFAFARTGDPWVRAFLREPDRLLDELFPRLQQVTGPYRVSGRVQIARTDLMRTIGDPGPGVLLLGDALQTSCPSTGTGLSRIFTDIDLLASEYLPRWLATPGMSAAKIGTFLQHPRKVQSDAAALESALYRRRARTASSLRWKTHRLRLRSGMELRATRLRMATWIESVASRAATFVRQPPRF